MRTEKELLGIGSPISRTRFVILFLVSAFVFQFASNALFGPVNGEWFPGTGSPMTWKCAVDAIKYPIKIILVEPLSPIFNDLDPATPVWALACTLYWTVIALALNYLLGKLNIYKKWTLAGPTYSAIGYFERLE